MKKLLCIILVILLSGCYRGDLDFSEFDYDDYEDQERESLGLFSLETFRPKAYKRQQFGNVPFPKVGLIFGYDDDLDQDYEEGFQDACQTHLSAIGRTLSRFRGPIFKGDKIANNEKYLRGFKDAEAYCLNRTDWDLH